MKEIRLCWSVVGRTNQEGEPIQGGLWHPKTEQTLRDLMIVMESGNKVYGEGTHWIEEWEA